MKPDNEPDWLDRTIDELFTTINVPFWQIVVLVTLLSFAVCLAIFAGAS